MLRSKLVLLLLSLQLVMHPVVAQEEVLNGISGFADLGETVEKLFSIFSRIDNSINKDKVKKMANKLHANVNDLILAKETILMRLQTNTDQNLDLGNEITRLKKQVDNLSGTLREYKDLVEAAGANALNLESKLNNDFLTKSTTLEMAAATLGGGRSNAEAKKTLITYFKTCIQLLKGTKKMLSEFKG